MAAPSDGATPFGGRALVLLLIVLAGTIALRLPTLEVPLERDEGEYAYIAWRMFEGEVPYRDAFDQKPPGVFAAYAAVFLVLGESVAALRVGVLLWTLGTLVVLALIARRVAGPTAAVLAAATFGVASSSPSLLAHAANTELFMILPMCAAVLLALRAADCGRALDWLLAGALAMAAFWFKQVAATSGLFVLGIAFVGARRGGMRALFAIAWMALGAVLASLPIVAWFVLADAWEPFVDAVFLHNLRYVQSVGLGDGLEALGGALGHQAADLWPLWLLAAAAIVLPACRARAVPMLLWALCLAVGVAQGLYFRPHYFVQLLPALCVLAGLGGAAAAEQLAGRTGGLSRTGALVVVAVLAVGPPVLARMDLLGEPPERIARQLYGANPFPESPRIASLIAEDGGPDDTVFILGSEPQMLWHARRRSATRYIFVYPLTGAYADAEDRQREVLAEVAEADPLHIVFVNLLTSHLRQPGSSRLMYDEIASLLQRRYQLEAIAWPQDNEGPFAMRRGERARALVASRPDWAVTAESIRVYRRRDDAP